MFQLNFSLASEELPVLPTVKYGQLELLSRAKISEISAQEVTNIAKEESKKHSDDGYLANRKVTECFDAFGCRYTGGQYNNELIHFRFRSPLKIVPGKKYPLIVWFHDAGESGNDNERQLAHLNYAFPFFAGPDNIDFFMLVTQCPSNNRSWTASKSPEGKGDAPFTIAAEIFEQVLKEFPIDQKRITTFGMCSGAEGATMLLKKYPELVSAIVYSSASAPAQTINDVPICSFHCTHDPNVSIDGMRKYVQDVNNVGGNAHLTEVDSRSHDSWGAALSKYKVIAWMTAQKKNSLLSPPPGIFSLGWSWRQVFIYFGIPLCCLVILFVARLLILFIAWLWRGKVV
ncbi:MAG: hypothetical protein LBJ00_03450 [Planctomycetaceae bacterium]|nr:hypothetical protein [Planctomycetaceae bacterium]